MYYTYNGIKIYYEAYKNNHNKSILILPGWGETRNTFYNIILYFRDKYDIYIIDYPGFGNSPIPNKDLTIYDYTELVKGFIKEQKIKNLYIIAHSFGGRIATILTGYYNLEMDKMIFMDTAGIKPKKTLKSLLKEKTYKFLKLICTTFFKNTKERKIRKLRKIFASDDYNNLNEKMLTTFRNIINEDLKKYYDNIKSNVLLIWGKKDIDTPLKDGEYMNKHIKNSELIVFKDGTHFTYLEYNYAINAIIENYLEEKVN